MTVSHDAYSELAAEDREAASSNAYIQWTHTPSGTPKGVCVWVVAAAAVTLADAAITSVTYGGVTMTLVDDAYQSTGEAGACWMYELLSGIPTGAQTVRANTSASPTSSSVLYPWFHGFAVTMASGGGALARSDTDFLESGSLANPSVTLSGGANTAQGYLGGWSGKNSEGDLTAAADCTVTGSYEWSATNTINSLSRRTTPASGDLAVGFTGLGDECAMVAASYYETSAMSDPMGMSGFFGV